MKSAIFFKVTTSYMTKVCMDQQQIIHFTLTSHHSHLVDLSVLTCDKVFGAYW